MSQQAMTLQDAARRCVERKPDIATPQWSLRPEGYGCSVRIVYIVPGKPEQTEAFDAGWWPVTGPNGEDQARESFKAANEASTALLDPFLCELIAEGGWMAKETGR